MSARQLRDPDFVDKVRARAASMGAPALVLEITERDGVGNDDESDRALRELHDARCAVRDRRLRRRLLLVRLPAGHAGADDQDRRRRSPRASTATSASCALLCSIMMMGQALGLDVVIEGIERTGQLDHLNDHVHAPFAQGYLMHRPMPLEHWSRCSRQNRGLPSGREVAPAV